jgi:hypothetical protein
MNPVKPQNDRWAEIREHGLFGRQLEPVFHSKMGRLLALALGVSVLGITFYWMFTYSGPYRYLAELQLKWLESYSPELTAVLTISGLLIGLLFGVSGIAVAIKFLFQGAERPVPRMPTSPNTTAAIGSTAIPEPAIQLAYRWQRYCRQAILYAAPLAVFGVGAYSSYNGTHAGSLRQLNAVDFQSGKVQARVVYADVRGHLSEKDLVQDYYHYIPMMSTETVTGPVHLVVGINEHEIRKYLRREADGTFSVRGVADKGLEGNVKYAFEKNGIAVADPVWVVHAGRDPSWDKQMGLITMGVGIVLTGLVFGWHTYRKRKSAAAAQAVQSAASI